MRPTGLWALLTIYQRLDQKEMSNEFWFSMSAAPAIATWNGVGAAGALYTPILTVLEAVSATPIKYVGCNLIVNDGTGSLGFDNYTTAGGTISGTYLPEDVSVVVQKDTASFLPGEHGRWYFSGVPDSFATGSYLNSTGIAAWLAALPTLLNSVTDQGVTYTPAHFSPKQSSLKPIVAVDAVGLLGTRRRRRFRF